MLGALPIVALSLLSGGVKPSRSSRLALARCTPLTAHDALVPRHIIGCYGCGAELQVDFFDSPGFVEPERYELKAARRQLRQTLCERCRRLSQGEIIPAVVEGRLRPAQDAAPTNSPGNGRGITTPEALRSVLKPLRERKALIALLVDLTDVAGTLLPRVRELIGANPILLIGTKADLLPRGTDLDEVREWLGGAANRLGGVLDILLLSSKQGDGMQVCHKLQLGAARAPWKPGLWRYLTLLNLAAARALMSEREGRDIFVLGAANVGKSAFLKELIPLISPSAPRYLPISASTPGTTLSLLPIDCFSGGSQLYDTPGVHLHHRMSARLLPAEIAMVMPRGKIKPYTPKSPSEQGTSFFWGGLVRVDIVSAPPAMRLSFCSPAAKLRVNTCATSEAETAHKEHAGVDWKPPSDKASAAELGPLRLQRTARVPLQPMKQSADLAISGFGWISVGCLSTLQQGPLEAVLEVWVPKGVEVFVRPPMPIGGLPTTP